jgi:hypothetical protein
MLQILLVSLYKKIMRTASTNPKSQSSVETGIRVIETATKERISLSEASRQHNKSRNFVSDIKQRLEDNYSKRNINRETYRAFNRALKVYNSTI